MSQISIVNLDFLESTIVENQRILGGRITPKVRLPKVSTAAATALDTSLTTRSTIDGDLETGFRFNRVVRGSAASAAASAVSFDGEAKAYAFADAG